MPIIKIILATPTLCGKDSEKLLLQANVKPTMQAMKKNNMLYGVLENIRKQ